MKPLPLQREDLSYILKHTSNLWDEARGKSFFITGGTGFFGMWLLESFAFINDELGLAAKICVLSRDPILFSEKAPHLFRRSDFHFIKGDIRSFHFPDENFDYLIHAATEASAKLNHEAPGEMLDAIVAGMQHILKFAEHAHVKKMLFTSSGAVYGAQPSDITHVSEDCNHAPNCLNPASAYGEGKRIAELMAAIHAKHHPCEMKIARCFAFVGPHLPLDTHFAIGNFLSAAIIGKPIQINGDGTPYRSYLYAADLAIWLWTILFKGKSLRPYNVGSAEDLPISLLAKTVKQAISSTSEINISQAPVPGASPTRYVPDVNRARTELNINGPLSLTESIQRTRDWLALRSASE